MDRDEMMATDNQYRQVIDFARRLAQQFEKRERELRQRQQPKTADGVGECHRALMMEIHAIYDEWSAKQCGD